MFFTQYTLAFQFEKREDKVAMQSDLMGMVKPVGAPFLEGSADKERWVLAMQMGRWANPCLLYRSILVTASGSSSMSSAP